MNSLGLKLLFGRTLKLLYLLMIFGSFASLLTAGTSVTLNITNSTIAKPLCQLYGAVHTGVFILGLVLLLVGAVMYAIGHIMPGQSKGTLQGYGMGMIFGGIIGVVISMLAGPILGAITGQGFTSTGAFYAYACGGVT
ncbi:MAG: hypothetical protein M1158_03780 [Candidatus Marsarchaeota archaeon]|jgi:hypothetical protein|nr:hypothetical protein [Candidatus Marsarchaeota archaeon]